MNMIWKNFSRLKQLASNKGTCIFCVVVLTLFPVPLLHGVTGVFVSPVGAGVMQADQGEFRISVNGQPVGTETFEIRPEGSRWIAQGNAEVKAGAAPASRITSHLTMEADGTPVSYNWSTEGAKKASAEIQFQNSVATVNLHLEGRKPFTQQFTFSSPLIAILDNNLYHQYAILARLYDHTKKGSQTFAVLVPQEMTPGSVTVESLAEPTDTTLGELKVQTADLEVDLYVDAKGRLMRLMAPASNAEVVRK